MGRTIAAKVQGNERRPYVQDVTFRRSADGRMSFSSTWPCPVDQSCKHVPAAPLEGVNGGAIPCHRGGVKPGQRGEDTDMQRGPIGPLCMSAAEILAVYVGLTSPVSGSALCSACWGSGRRRAFDCLRR